MYTFTRTPPVQPLEICHYSFMFQSMSQITIFTLMHWQFYKIIHSKQKTPLVQRDIFCGSHRKPFRERIKLASFCADDLMLARVCVCLSMSSDHLSCIKAQCCLLVLTKWWNSGIIRVLEISYLCISHTSDSRDEEKGQLTQPAVHFVVWEGTRSYHAFEVAKSDWWHECVAAVIMSSTFIKLFLSEEKVPTFYPKDGQKECITSGAAITASSYPFLISYYTQRGRGETGEEMRGQEPSMIRQLFHWDHTVMGEAN